MCNTRGPSKHQNLPGRRISRFQCLRRAHGFSSLAKDEVSYNVGKWCPVECMVYMLFIVVVVVVVVEFEFE